MLKFTFHLLIFGDVGEDRQGARVATVFDARSTADHDRNSRAVFADDLEFVSVCCAVLVSLVSLLNARVLFGWNNSCPMLAYQFIRGVTQHSCGSRVDKGDPAPGIFHDNALGHVLDDALIELLQPLEFLLCLLVLNDLPLEFFIEFL